MSDPRRSREKIIILGGGVGAMTAAYYLTEAPGWRERYDIVVYQMGWRLGGKGASGRNHLANERIEEHGLHVWFGFYENAFRMIQRCYTQLHRPSGSPMPTWREAFEPIDFAVYEDHLPDGSWSPWGVCYPFNGSVPGQATTALRPLDLLGTIVEWTIQRLLGLERIVEGRAAPGGSDMASLVDRFVRQAALDLRAAMLTAEGVLARGGITAARLLLFDREHADATQLGRLARFFERIAERFWERVRTRIDDDPISRHLWMELDLFWTIARGILADGVLVYGFDSVDRFDFRAWLLRHGADPKLTVDGSWVRAAYDLVFGFHKGRATGTSGHQLAAGVALRGLLRLAFEYRGAVGYRMRAGMGDVIFAPLYELLEERGVRFEFFHRVRHLTVSRDGETIDGVELGVQARTRSGPYRPLRSVGGLPSWPHEPLYDQLEGGEALTARFPELESAWTQLPEETLHLRRGKDFDHVVLGIPVGALGPICADLERVSPRWRAMRQRVDTVGTQAFQLWLERDLPELGWNQPSQRTAPIVSGYREPVDTWADMRQVLPAEGWSEGQRRRPATVVYFCGALADQPNDHPDWSTTTPTEYLRKQNETVRDVALSYLRNAMRAPWPLAYSGGAFDWDALSAPDGVSGEARLDAQYFRANVEPSERYVLSRPGTTAYRLKSDRSGFTNLVLAGDWTYTAMNGGCVEAAVMSGMRAARALCGEPRRIVGDVDF